MNATLDPSVDRFKALQSEHPENAEAWHKKLTAFRNLYAFLGQIIPYQDSDLEKLYIFYVIYRQNCPIVLIKFNTTSIVKFN